MTAFSSLVSRLVLGGLADRVDIRRLAAALFLLQAATLLGFTLAQGRPALDLASALLGTTVGNIFMLHSLLVARVFGPVSYGTVYGMQQMAAQIAGGLGPVVLGAVSERMAGYDLGVRGLAMLAVCAALLILRVDGAEATTESRAVPAR